MNFTNDNPESHASVVIAKLVLFWFASVMGCVTILTHITQILGVTFKVYAYISFLLMLAMFFLTWILFRRQCRKITRYDRETLSFLLLFGLGGAFISSFFHIGAFKVSPDLFYYVPNAVYHLQNPDSPMDFGIHFLEAGKEPFISYLGATSLPFEYIQAVIAYFFGIDYLSVFFLLSPALLGFLLPITIFYLLCQFVNPKSAAAGTFFVVAIILLLGETPRTPGTWSFPNIYSGKVFFISMGIPLFAAVTVNFFRTPSPFNWLLVFAVTTALVGSTTSSMAVLPVLTVAVVIACAVASSNGYRNFIKHSLTYLLGLSYLFIYTLTVFLNFNSDVSEKSPINSDFPTTFLGHAGFFLEQSGPATPLVLMGCTVSAVLFTTGNVRKFILAWMAATLILFLNPIVSPFLIKYLTTPNIYWRLFYVYPMPLLLGLTGAGLYEYTARFSKQVRFAIISGTASVLFIAHFVPFTTSVLYLRTEFDWPRYKIPPASARSAAAVIAVAPPGPMLAPMPLNGIITMLSAAYPQMRVFTDADRAWFGRRGMSTEIENRICASEFVNGGQPDCLPAFQAVAGYDILRSIVIAQSAAADPQVQHVLERSGYVHHETVDDLLVYWR